MKVLKKTPAPLPEKKPEPKPAHQPVINVNVPDQAPPIIQVSSAAPVVNVPKQIAPAITVNVPPQPPPVVNVDGGMKWKKIRFKIKRNNGWMDEITAEVVE